jgi:hypothetical protein
MGVAIFVLRDVHILKVLLGRCSTGIATPLKVLFNLIGENRWLSVQ